jgi:hypothetical protein
VSINVRTRGLFDDPMVGLRLSSGLGPVREMIGAIDGDRQAWIEDPDGSRIEFMQINPLAMQMRAIAPLGTVGVEPMRTRRYCPGNLAMTGKNGCNAALNCAKRGNRAPGGGVSRWRVWADPLFG